MVFPTKMDCHKKKLSDTNKNVTKVGVIIKGVYYVSSLPAKTGNMALQNI
jgi:hypothetical protein